LNTKFEAAGLIVLLFIVTLALGFELGGSGLSGTSPGPGQTKIVANKGTTISLPEFVFRAKGISPMDLYQSSSYRNILPSMLVPLAGLRATLTPQKSLVASHGRTPSLAITTNSSGLAAIFDLPGNYTFLISSAYYQLDTIVSLAFNTTTTLNFTLQPSAEVVTSLRISSPDSILGVEPLARLFALVNGSGPTAGFAELVGFEHAYQTYGPPGNVTVVTYGPLVEVNTTVIGGYQGTQGFWAALSPSGSYPAYPTEAVLLFQYRTLYEVSFAAG
jgi:hypothetical protein